MARCWSDGTTSCAGAPRCSRVRARGEPGVLCLVGDRAPAPPPRSTSWCGARADCRVLRAAGVPGEQSLGFGVLSLLLAGVDLGLLPSRPQRALRAAVGEVDGPADRLAVAVGLAELLGALSADRPLLLVVDDLGWVDPDTVQVLGAALRRLAGERVLAVLAGRRSADLPGGLPAAVELGPVELGPLEPAAAARERVDALPNGAREALLLLALEGRGDPRLVHRLVAPGDLEALLGAGLVGTEGDRVVVRQPLVQAAVLELAPPATRRAAHAALALRLGAADPDRALRHRALSLAGPDAATSSELAALGRRQAVRGAAGRGRGGTWNGPPPWRRPPGRRRRCSPRPRRRRCPEAARRSRARWWTGPRRPGPTTHACWRSAPAWPACRGSTPRRPSCSVPRRGPARPRTAAASCCSASGRRTRRPCRTCSGTPSASWRAARVCRPTCSRPSGPWSAPTRAAPGSTGPTAPRCGRSSPGRSRSRRRPTCCGCWQRPRTRPASWPCPSAWSAGPPWALRASGDAVASAEAFSRAAFLAFHLGHWAAAEAGLVTVEELVDEALAPVVVADGLAVRAELSAAQGRADTCRAQCRRLRALADRLDQPWYDVLADRREALLELGAGRETSALDLLERGASTLARSGAWHPFPSPAAELVEVLVRLERPAEAAAAGQVFLSRTGPGAPPQVRARALRIEALLAAPGEADAAYRESARLDGEVGLLFLQARTQLCHGERLRRERHRNQAQAVLSAALTTFDRLGATPWHARAAAELAACGGHLDGAARTGPSLAAQLTPQELQIAVAVSEGKRNREISAALFLSLRTVEFHLSNVYRKLEVTGRTQLVSRLAGG